MESELVSGFMTEHAAVIFVFFFLAEYASIVLICILISILFLGGYLFNLSILTDILPNFIYFSIDLDKFDFFFIKEELSSIIKPLEDGILYSLCLSIKTCIMIFVFIWARASFPRIRFDQLMSFCWTVLLPIVITFIIIIPCLIFCLNILPSNLTI